MNGWTLSGRRGSRQPVDDDGQITPAGLSQRAKQLAQKQNGTGARETELDGIGPAIDCQGCDLLGVVLPPKVSRLDTELAKRLGKCCGGSFPGPVVSSGHHDGPAHPDFAYCIPHATHITFRLRIRYQISEAYMQGATPQ
jgi:hypothetical protein